MRPGTDIAFVKYHGAGNDFVCVDDRDLAFGPYRHPGAIARVCDRHYGVGADGLILLQYADGDAGPGALRMVYYNSDGAPSSFCGNGSRCFLKFALDQDLIALPKSGQAPPPTEFLASDGWHVGWALSQNEFCVSMLVEGSLERLSAQADRVDTGSPHYVQWGTVLPEGDITAAARAIRYGPAFAKTGINVNYATVVDPAGPALAVRTYERGVEGETQACGTGVTAVALSFAERRALVGPARVTVRTLGGELSVSFTRSAGGAFGDVTLAGPAERVFSGTLDVGMLG